MNSRIVSAVPHDRMDDTQQLAHDGHDSSTGEPFVVVVHDAVFSDHLYSRVIEDFPDQTSPSL
jgi:hypothetical protein